MAQLQKRNTAYKLRIGDILTGKYVKKENELNYLESGGNKLYRVNLIGTVVLTTPEEGSQSSSLIIDDGTGRLLLRSFDNMQLFEGIDVGDLLLVIGKLREYGNERYVIPEIVKRIDDKGWARIREIELGVVNAPEKQGDDIKEEDIIADKAEKKTPNSQQRICQLITELDKGDGADIEELITKSKLESADKIIEEMVKGGSIYEVRAGRVKLV